MLGPAYEILIHNSDNSHAYIPFRGWKKGKAGEGKGGMHGDELGVA